jgi:hypothetical protein
MDCFATWCIPCKEMEKNVFSKKNVGEFFNEHFISVRLQMNKTKNDGPQTKSWYSIASEVRAKYGIPSYPCFLFFTPQGEIKYRTSGYQYDELLIEAGKTALSLKGLQPYRIYYQNLAKYLEGKKDYSVMAGLADTARLLGQNEVAISIAKEYLPYLLMKRTEWYTRENLFFMANFLKGSTDSFFTIFYKNGSLVDSLLGIRGFSRFVVDTIIQHEEIDPIVKPITGMRLSTEKLVIEKEPEWKVLEERISKMYNYSYADRNLLYARVRWYNDHHEWAQSARYLTLYLKKYPIEYMNEDLATFLNYTCWVAIFLRSVDKEQIDSSIEVMSKVLRTFIWPELQDTYANLLYKAGKIDDAIKYEENAIKTKPDDRGMQETVYKMRNRLPTWPHYISSAFWDQGL